MATYITLLRWTQQGIQNVKESPKRLDAARKQFEALGAKVKDFYLVTGQYDMVLISEAPDIETATRLALGASSQGNVRTETLRAFTEAEYRKIIESLP
jgi:uncharacterized protein with GYD domain